jgi:anti-sigma regulatory factor (Ser/Thr protein kinase)
VPNGAAKSSTGISVSIARDPALVRTVRLVAAAVARRTGQDEDFVEEVRLAVGEACALLVGEHGSDDVVDPVTVSMAINARLRVEVAATGQVAVEDAPHSDLDGVEPWALLRGLIDDFSIDQQGSRTRLSMSWPLG